MSSRWRELWGTLSETCHHQLWTQEYDKGPGFLFSRGFSVEYRIWGPLMPQHPNIPHISREVKINKKPTLGNGQVRGSCPTSPLTVFKEGLIFPVMFYPWEGRGEQLSLSLLSCLDLVPLLCCLQLHWVYLLRLCQHVWHVWGNERLPYVSTSLTFTR